MSVPKPASDSYIGGCPPVLALVDASALLAHEEVEEDRLQELAQEIQIAGELREPVLVDRRTMVILDGHHRVKVLRSLGCSVIPAYLVDYQDSSIQVKTRRPDIAVDKEEVVKRGLEGSPFPPRTSLHMMTLVLHPRAISISRLTEL